MDKARADEIIAALSAKGVKGACPRCGNKTFEIAGESMFMLQEKPNAIVLGGPSIPVVLVICSNCAYLTQHAQMPLGLWKGEQ